jgi:hypothetical protein
VGNDGKRIGTSYTLDVFANFPSVARWNTGHWRCLDDLADCYDIGVEDLRTHEGVVSWVAHLLGKNWIQHTDFGQWLRAHTLSDKD